MGEIFDVLVIGCGISGVAASAQLSRNGISHIILESRDRIGGRINSQVFRGSTVQTGASFLHSPDQNNKIAAMLQEWKWEKESADYESTQYLMAGIGEAKKDVINQAEMLFDEMMEGIEEVKHKNQNDLSLEQAAKGFIEGLGGKNEQVVSLVKWNLNILGNTEGAQLSQISVKEFDNDQNYNDCIPINGYFKIISQIIQQYSPNIHLNTKVTKIDYQNTPILIFTQNGHIYHAKKVICSLPLAVLQKQLVLFTPTLPQGHLTSIKKLGISIANKIFADFQLPFWDTNKKWINFVTNKTNFFPVAMATVKEGSFRLCFFVSGSASISLLQKTDSQIKTEMIQFLQGFNFSQQIKLSEILVTRWHKDANSLGSYSYLPMGATSDDILSIRSAINEKLWLVGQHCYPEMNGCAHAAFQSGIVAAQQLVQTLKDSK